MNEADLLPILARGEDSRHQFKRGETNADSIAAELAAFANRGSKPEPPKIPSADQRGLSRARSMG